MKDSFATIAGLLLALQASLGAAVSVTNSTNAASYGYIVELDPGSSFRGPLAGRDDHAEFHRLARDVAAYTVRHEFKNAEFFYGLSIDAKNNSDVAALKDLPGVKAVYPNKFHARPGPVEVSGSGFSSVASSSLKAARSAASVAHIKGSSDVLSSLKMTGVDAVHELGLKGKGVKIGILDTGVDYYHPALGGGFGEGFKIAGGYDLVGDDYTGANLPVPDSDPLASCLSGGHGTHVAGIIGAQDPDGVGFGITGVAPEATLYMYRVLGCNGGVTDDVMMQGFQRAAEDGVDLISMSIGGAYIWTSGSPWIPLLDAIQKRGIGMVIAAGNDGQYGLYATSSPSYVPAAISVGSVGNTKFATLYNAADSAGNTIEYVRIVPHDPNGTWNVFVPSSEDGFTCDQQPWWDAAAAYPDPSRVIVLLGDGSPCAQSIDFYLDKTGFQHVFSYVPDDSDLSLYPPGYISGWELARIKQSQADKMIAAAASQGRSYTLSFPDQSVHDTAQPSAGTMSYFSTYGPTMEMALKPQLSAPGGTILSTWPTADGWGYAVISGTSMATPHVAGCYALIKQKFPNLTPQEIASRLQDTSTPLTQYGDPGFLTTVLQQGSGLINVFKALTYDTALSPTEFNLLDSSQLREESFTIENLSGSSKTYHLANMPAAAVDALPFLDQKPVDWTWSLVNNPAYACASFPSRTVTVGPNSKETVKVTIKPPTGLNPSKLPTYGGYILVTDGEKQYVIPYQGVPYSRSEQQTLDTSNLSNITTKPLPPAGIPNVPLVRAIDINRRDNDLMTFTFPAWAPPPDSDEDQDDDNNPLFFFVLRQPSPYLRLDAVSVDLADTFTPSSLGYDPTVKFTTNKPALPFDETFAGVPSYGMVFSLVGGFDKPPSRFQEIYGGYGQYGFQWSWAEVALSNGTLLQLPNADYRVLIRALKWGYDVEDANGYESWLSPILRVNISDPGYPNPYN